MFDPQLGHMHPEGVGVDGSLGRRHAGKDQRKFLAAISARDVLPPAVRLQDLSDLFEDPIPGTVAVRVVELFEVIEIEHDHRDRLLGARRAAELPLERFLPVPAAWRTGRRCTTWL